MQLNDFFEWATKSFELLGVLSMVVGFLYAFALAAVTWQRTADGRRAFKTLRETLGGAILLGLELLVAADIVKTVTATPVEIDGVAPWRKALTTGPQVLARATRESAWPVPVTNPE